MTTLSADTCDTSVQKTLMSDTKKLKLGERIQSTFYFKNHLNSERERGRDIMKSGVGNLR